MRQRNRIETPLMIVAILFGIYAFLMFLAGVAHGQEGKMTINQGTMTHSVLAPNPPSTTAPADFDFTGRTVIGLPLGNTNQGTRLLSGGGVAYTGTGLNFIISAAKYYINGIPYTSLETAVTLHAADPSNDRIDVFYVDNNGLAGVITGTPGGPPLEPSVDPTSQLKLTTAYVPAGSSTPTITIENIYLENTEWTMTTNSSGTINLASTNNPYAGTKCIEGTNTTTGNYFQGVKPASGTVQLSNFANLVLHIRSKAAWPKQKSIVVSWVTSAISGSATITDGAYNFNSSNTTTYQQIVIPVSVFGLGTTPVSTIRFTVTGTSSVIGWYVDNISLQSSLFGTAGGDFSTNVVKSVAGDFVQFADTTGKLGTDLGNTTSTDGTFTANSDALFPSQKAIKTYIASLVPSGITPSALTRVNDTNVTLTLGGTPNTALLQATSLTLGWSGTLAVGRGGTGVASLGNITETNDTNVTLTLGGTPTGAVINSTSFTLGWTGTLAVARGGTGAATASAHTFFANNTGSTAAPSFTSFVSGTDYAPATSGIVPLKGNGSGGFSNAVASDIVGLFSTCSGTQYLGADGACHTATVTIPHAATFVVDGHNTVLTAATYAYVKIPAGGTLQSWALIGSPSGSITVDILRSANSGGLPTASIIGGSGVKPALSSAVENSSTSFTSWTSTTLTTNDNLAIALSGITSTTYVALTLYYQ